MSRITAIITDMSDIYIYIYIYIYISYHLQYALPNNKTSKQTKSVHLYQSLNMDTVFFICHLLGVIKSMFTMVLSNHSYNRHREAFDVISMNTNDLKYDRWIKADGQRNIYWLYCRKCGYNSRYVWQIPDESICIHRTDIWHISLNLMNANKGIYMVNISCII